MKNKIKALILLFGIAGVAHAADTVFRTDNLQLGRPTSGVVKKFTFDTNDGGSNKVLGLDTGKNLFFTPNNMTMGDGGNTTDKKIIVDKGAGGSNPFMIYDHTGNKWRFSNDGVIVSDFGSGSGGGGTGGGIEAVEQRCEATRQGLGLSGLDEFNQGSCENFQPNTVIKGTLLQTLSSASTSAIAVWNAIPLNSANPDSNFDAAMTAWSGTDAGSIATTASFKIGTSATQWNKTGTGTVSCIQKDLGASSFISVGSFGTVYIFYSLPTTSNFTSFEIRMSADAATPTNYAAFRKTTVVNTGAGTSPTTGYQLLTFNLYATPDATAGTGWTPGASNLRTMGICTNWSSSGQVATGQAFDALFFVPNSNGVVPEYQQLISKGDTFSIANSSGVEFNSITTGSADVVGPVTLSTGAANTYTGGSGSTLRRSTMDFTNKQGVFSVDTALTSGAVSLAQSVIKKKTMSTSVTNGTTTGSISFDSPLGFTISTIPGGTTFKVPSTVDFSAQMPSGTVMHVCNTNLGNNKKNFSCNDANNITLTSNTTFASSQLTFTVGNTAALSVGQFVWKAEQVGFKASLVPIGTAETFVSGTRSEVLVYDNGIPYPATTSVAAHYRLGGYTSTDATQNRQKNTGVLPSSLSVLNAGPATQTFPFLNGQFASSGFTGSNGYFMLNSDSLALDPALGGAQFSQCMWYQDSGFASGAHNIETRSNASSNGYYINLDTSGVIHINAISGFADHSTGLTLPSNTWSLLCWSHDTASTAWKFWLNGATHSFTGGVVSSGADLQLMAFTSSTTNANLTGKIADWVVWENYLITDADVNAIYNGGAGRILGTNSSYKYRYTFSPTTGQVLSGLGQIFRTSTAIAPFITKMDYITQ